MTWRNTADSWGWPARVLHWAMAGLVVFMLGLGFYMVEVLSSQQPETVLERFLLTQVHKSWGTVAFALACLRLAWRAANPAPALPATTSAFARWAARWSHVALYACLFLMPVTGWLMASASPLQDSYGLRNLVFGLFELPDPFTPGSERLEAIFKTAHFALALLLTGLVAVHVAAALKHHLWDRDSVLRRMTFGAGRLEAGTSSRAA